MSTKLFNIMTLIHVMLVLLLEKNLTTGMNCFKKKKITKKIFNFLKYAYCKTKNKIKR